MLRFPQILPHVVVLKKARAAVRVAVTKAVAGAAEVVVTEVVGVGGRFLLCWFRASATQVPSTPCMPRIGREQP